MDIKSGAAVEGINRIDRDLIPRAVPGVYGKRYGKSIKMIKACINRPVCVVCHIQCMEIILVETV